MDITSQDEYIINSIKHFYKDEKNLKILEDILMQKTNISLRILDHFPNNFAREHNIVINGIHIYSDYKDFLKGYAKRKFDPFCRGDCIKMDKSDMSHEIFINEDDSKIQKVTDTHIITTIRQLKFFKWCIDRDIIEYISNHLQDIQKSVSESNKSLGKKNKVQIFKKVSTVTVNFD